MTVSRTASRVLDALIRPSPRAAWTVFLLLSAAGLIGGAVVVALRDMVLPERFFSDGLTIQGIANGAPDHGDLSYGNVARIYRWLGLADAPLAASILGYLVVVLAVLFVCLRLRKHPPPLLAGAIACAALMLGAIYLGFYSKDVIVVAVVVVVIAVGRRLWLAESAIVLAMLVYAAAFRRYWFLVLAGYLVLRLVAWRRYSLVSVAIGSVALVVCFALAIPLGLGQDPDHFRTAVNSHRTAEEVNTLISPFLPGNGVATGVANVLLTFFSLIAPLPLALEGPAYLVAALFIAALWAVFLISLPSTSSSPRARIAIPYVRRAAVLVMAFVVTQALFEPDYGSAVRHLTPLLSLFLLVVWTARRAPARRQFTGETSVRLEGDRLAA